MDVFTPEKRSNVMKRIKNHDTNPEVFVRRLLFSQGFRYRLHIRSLPGCPDIVLAKFKTVIFVNGCFWHHHEDCPRASMPSSRTEYWTKKLVRNVERDKRVQSELVEQGWRVLVVWECACRKRYAEELTQLLVNFLSSGDLPFAEIGRNTLNDNRSRCRETS